MGEQCQEAMDADEEMPAAPTQPVDMETQWKKAFVVEYRRRFPNGGGQPEKDGSWPDFLVEARKLVNSPLGLQILDTYPPTENEMHWLSQPGVEACARWQATKSAKSQEHAF